MIILVQDFHSLFFLFLRAFGSNECLPGGSRCHGFKTAKMTEGFSIEKTLHIDIIVSVGGEKVSVIRWQLLNTLVPEQCQFSAKSEDRLVKGDLCKFFWEVMLRPLKKEVSLSKSELFLSCMFSFCSGLHLHIFLMWEVIRNSCSDLHFYTYVIPQRGLSVPTRSLWWSLLKYECTLLHRDEQYCIRFLLLP